MFTRLPALKLIQLPSLLNSVPKSVRLSGVLTKPELASACLPNQIISAQLGMERDYYVCALQLGFVTDLGVAGCAPACLHVPTPFPSQSKVVLCASKKRSYKFDTGERRLCARFAAGLCGGSGRGEEPQVRQVGVGGGNAAAAAPGARGQGGGQPQCGPAPQPLLLRLCARRRAEHDPLAGRHHW